MTNEEWLEHLAHNDIPGLRAWFKAEHVESPGSEALVQCAQIDGEGRERAAEGDTDALNAKIAELERKLRISWEYECKFQAERDELQEQVDALRSRHCPHYDATEHTCDVHETRIAELTAEREQYRKLFGMALDWAHEITMLETSIDEGMA